MRYHALACDFDGTVASSGEVNDDTLAALKRASQSGRRLLLVTGRELDDLRRVFDRFEIFDMIVAENGALLYNPKTHEEIVLAPPIDERFVPALEKAGVTPLRTGRIVVATWEPNENIVLDTIQELGLELQVIFNKGAVMVLPSGYNKASGVIEALDRLGLSTHNVVGVGDAENDQAFLAECEFSCAVANAVPAVKERVDLVLKKDHGAGVIDLVSQLIETDLAELTTRLPQTFPIGIDTRGRSVDLPVHGQCLLFAGGSGSGKSTLAKGFVERLSEARYQFCIVDPEGDYEGFEEGLVLGDRARVPAIDEVLQVLKDPDRNVVVNLLGVSLAERPEYFAALLKSLQDLRARTGRPHWLIVDEAHHVLPRERNAGTMAVPSDLTNTVFVTVEPQTMLPEAVKGVSAICTVGEQAQATLAEFAAVIGKRAPAVPRRKVKVGEGLVWPVGHKVRRFSVAATRLHHLRHRRKYATGDLGPDESFYFRGPEERLNLQAQNLILFAQVARGVDDETWLFHLKRSDYTNWFRYVIKDNDLADEAAKVEKRRVTAGRSRELIFEAIADRYTLPAETGTS